MLTDAKLRNAKPKEKAYRLTDRGGLHLYVTPGGGRLWRLRYEIAGVEKLLSFGPYPAVTLADARQAREDAKATLRAGRDPSAERKLRHAVAPERTFEALARAWHAQQTPTWTPVHAADVLTSLENHIFPRLGALEASTITPQQLLAELRVIEARPAIETARRVRQRVSSVFLFAIASGAAMADPAAVVKDALAPVVKGQQPALTGLDDVRQVLRDAEAESAHPVTKLALRLLALTAVRPGEVRGALWSEFDGAVWRIPAERMKMKRDHIAPLSRQAVEVVDAVRSLTGDRAFVFPNARQPQKPMSENAIGYLLNRAGYHARHVPHGWRAAFSTIMNEHYPADRAVIDLILAHAPKDKTESAYNRATHLARRAELAQAWADLLLDGMPAAAALLDGPRR